MWKCFHFFSWMPSLNLILEIQWFKPVITHRFNFIYFGGVCTRSSLLCQRLFFIYREQRLHTHRSTQASHCGALGFSDLQHAGSRLWLVGFSLGSSSCGAQAPVAPMARRIFLDQSWTHVPDWQAYSYPLYLQEVQSMNFSVCIWFISWAEKAPSFIHFLELFKACLKPWVL